MAETHTRRFTLERYLAAELGPAEHGKVAEHLATCPTCSADLAALQDDHTAFAEEVPYAAFRIRHEAAVARTEPQPKRRGAWQFALSALRTFAALGAAGALGAAAVLVMVTPPPLGPSERIKGGSQRLSFSVQQGDSMRPGLAGERLLAGTSLQLSYEAGDADFLAVLGIDANAAVSQYFPEGGEAMAPLPSGRVGPLPFSLRLDATPGAERFYALFAKKPVPIKDLMDAARRIAGPDPSTLGDLPLPKAVGQASIWIQKALKHQGGP